MWWCLMLKNQYNYNNQTGMYRQKIKLTRRTVTTDALLQPIETFEEYGSYWAMIKTFDNRQELQSGTEQTRVRKRFVVKYAKSLQEFLDSEHTSFELEHKGIIYDVREAVNDNELNVTITIYVEARV